MKVMRSRAIIVVVLLVVLGGLFLTEAESHVCYSETRVGVRSQNFTPDFEKAAPQNPDYTSLEQFLTDNFTSSTLVIQKEFDSTHLAYFGARYYDPTTGRFTNPDPFMGHLTDPRSQFMYGYGYNNPFSFWDLFGFQSRRVDKDGNLLYKHEVVPYYSQKEIDEINEGFFLQFYDRLTMGMTAQEKEQVIRLENLIKQAEASGDQEKVRQAITELVNFKVDQIKFDPTGCAGGIKIVGKQASKPASKILLRYIDDLIERTKKLLKTDTNRTAGSWSWSQYWNRIRARQIGNVKHSLYKLERLQYYQGLGRVEGVGDFTLEKAVRYTQGPKQGQVVNLYRDIKDKITYGIPDEIDYVHHVIRDVKPITANQQVLAEIEDYYIQLYREATGGITPRVEFINYDRALSGLR